MSNQVERKNLRVTGIIFLKIHKIAPQLFVLNNAQLYSWGKSKQKKKKERKKGY